MASSSAVSFFFSRAFFLALAIFLRFSSSSISSSRSFLAFASASARLWASFRSLSSCFAAFSASILFCFASRNSLWVDSLASLAFLDSAWAFFLSPVVFPSTFSASFHLSVSAFRSSFAFLWPSASAFAFASASAFAFASNSDFFFVSAVSFLFWDTCSSISSAFFLSSEPLFW